MDENNFDQIRKFLEKIRSIESSNGVDIDHPVVETGIHSGDSAIGQYGLMPNTVQEMAKRMGNKELADVPRERMKDVLGNNPLMEDQLAEYMAKHVIDKQGDEEKAAYSWNMGHNTAPEKITDDKLDSSDYVQKFRRLNGVLSSNNK